MDYTVFRENLRRLIETRGMSLKTFGEELGVSPAALSRYLSEKRNPELPYVVRIAAYFNVSTDWLLGISGDMFEIMPKDVQEMVYYYQLASSDDREVIRTVLAKYKRA